MLHWICIGTQKTQAVYSALLLRWDFFLEIFYNQRSGNKVNDNVWVCKGQDKWFICGLTVDVGLLCCSDPSCRKISFLICPAILRCPKIF